MMVSPEVQLVVGGISYSMGNTLDSFPRRFQGKRCIPCSFEQALAGCFILDVRRFDGA